MRPTEKGVGVNYQCEIGPDLKIRRAKSVVVWQTTVFSGRGHSVITRFISTTKVYFPSSLLVVLSAVYMDVSSPHKM